MGALYLVQQVRTQDGDLEPVYHRIQPEDFPWVMADVAWMRYWIEWRRDDETN